MRAAGTLGALERVLAPVAIEATSTANVAAVDPRHFAAYLIKVAPSAGVCRTVVASLLARGAAAVRLRIVGPGTLEHVAVAVHAFTLAGPTSFTSRAIFARR